MNELERSNKKSRNLFSTDIHQKESIPKFIQKRKISPVMFKESNALEENEFIHALIHSQAI
jgi:hypothetical protein